MSKSPCRHRPLFTILISCLLSLSCGLVQAQSSTLEAPAAASVSPKELLATVAEASGFEATATGGDVERFMRRLASFWTDAELGTIGRTVEGRPIWSLVVAPQERTENEPITVLMLGGIHSGECDGKEALLALARDMALGEQGDWWHQLRLIFVPNFNADGNERRSKTHRPGQGGPAAGMGVRENSQGLDLNRDFVKLESPEVRSLVAALNQYDVDVLIDTHTTNGSLHQYQLTYDIPHNPAAPAALDQWLRQVLMPQVSERLRAENLETFFYGNFDAPHRRWATYGHEPRYSTEYMGMRGKIGILAESYSYESYETRFQVSYHFVRQVLMGLAENEGMLRQLLDDAARESQPGIRVPIRAELAKTAEAIVVKGFQTAEGALPERPFGPQSLESHQKRDYVVQLWNRASPTKEILAPAQYAIPKQYAWAANRLVRHGISLRRLDSDQRLKVGVYHLQQVEEQPEFQRHRRLTLEVESSQQERLLPAGTWIVDTAQPLGKLATHLMEPEADDSLASWNFLDPDLHSSGEYPIYRIETAVDPGLTSAVPDVEPTEEITLEHLFAPGKTVDYSANSLRRANWLKDKPEYVVAGSYGESLVIDAASGARRPLTELNRFRQKLASLDAFNAEQARAAATIQAFADDWKHALVAHAKELYFFDADSDTVRQLTHTPEMVEQLPEMSPDGAHVAFVRDNNLWLVDCETTELRQLTSDGSSEVLNGILDWVYQEELYGRGNFKGFWWSPDGRQIAFLKLDQTRVPAYQVSDSISYGQTLEATRYPKAGQDLPDVSLWLVDIESGNQQEVDLSAFPSNDRLVGRVSWSPDGQLWAQVFNRVQNQQSLLQVNTALHTTRNLFTEISPGWIEIRGTPHFLPDGDFLWLSDLPDGRTHLHRVAVATGARTQLTSGDWDVSELLSVSDDHSTVFVTGNIGDPIQSHLLAVDLASGSTVQITSAPGTHRPSVDASGKYFLDTFSSTDSPPFVSLHSIDGQMLRVVDAPISDRYQFVNIQPPHALTIRARDGLELQAQLLLPPNDSLQQYASAEKSGETEVALPKLPVIFHVYGGPQAPTVSNTWGGRNYWWHQMLCQQGFAVVLCDNRSARGRGVADTWTIRGDLCRVELQDLEDAVNWVAQQPWADADRIGLWGWSYGGYFTSYALTHSKLFRCGIAGAPVTDWRNYDAIYTERYMDLPQNNESGYDSSSVVKAAANLHGDLLLIHGERDDNVHMSNTLQLVYALQKAGKKFELMIYPKNRHGITDPDQRLHLHRTMTDFFQRHLAPVEKPLSRQTASQRGGGSQSLEP
ncbi:MAG: DPP IV N-terminal domain-containing protein [bacterium]|nr:DPP IV N-terminal domain-containing protein [bacterium]